MTKTKADTPLDRLTARLRAALRSETKNIIEIGKLLKESRTHLEHGEWQRWLAKNFDLSQRTALRYTNACDYAAKRGARGAKMDTVSVLNLSPTVLYGLAEGRYDEREEAAILAAARKGRVDLDAARAICEELASAADDDADGADDRGDDDVGETAAAGDPEITAILDGPPPAVPPPAPNAEPIDFALRDFDQAIDALKRLSTKSSTQFARTVHSADDLEGVESFVRNVMKARRQITDAAPPLEEKAKPK